jgi:hypothetical protein
VVVWGRVGGGGGGGRLGGAAGEGVEFEEGFGGVEGHCRCCLDMLLAGCC